MTAKANRAHLLAELDRAGWTFARTAVGGHSLYRCPCGEHFATVTTSTTKDGNRAGPIVSRIRRCAAQQTQTKTAA